MFAIAARQLGYRVQTFSPDNDTPTGQVADVEIVGSYGDLPAIKQFAAAVDVITFEFENVPAATAQAAAENTLVRPAGSVLHSTQHRLREKSFLANHGFPVAPFRPVRSLADLRLAADDLGYPCVLKTAGFGYDGKGQYKIQTAADVETAWKTEGHSDHILEGFI
ncbi:MAG: ATP-grasp domain-containing protein, partial [Planctomycetota bacterium]|nr:ATP-grasp domain-containing protein [Planctomycetota bacterium]